MTESQHWPCVLTATFRPGQAAVATALRDETARMRQYADALRWAACTATARGGLVFAENSGVHSPLVADHIRALRARGVPVEYHEMGHEPFVGKGRGEGRMLEHVAAHSPLLASHDAFTKITGRLRLVNHRQIAGAIRRLLQRVPDLAFVAQSFSSTVHPDAGSQFFWARRDFFLTHLADAYHVTDDNAGIFLEHAFGARLRELAPRHAIYVLRLPVLIDGINGWNARPVQAKHFQWRLRLCDLFLRRGPALVPLASLDARFSGKFPTAS